MISDNGKGFDVHQIFSRKNPSSGMGLINIQERIINYDGKFKIESAPNKGTVLVVEIPNKKSLWKTKNI
ncbi:MAG: hypothetical protein A2V66_17880 [Ignavibacteria bacterium RBG_13_36_8]|nr:MAG: hypothetical protein A2V66_17880 [Ignavibacteria bacterium RBG_13_36_8]